MKHTDIIDQEKVGKFLKELRTNKKVSQRQLAEELYLTRQSVSLWENGKTLPDYDSAVLLANYFNISIGELFAGKYITDKEELNRATANVIRIELKKSQKRLIELITVIILFILLFLAYFFLNTYNSIHVYTVNFENNGLEVNGILTKAVNDVYLNIDVNNNYDKLCLFYGENTQLICRNNANSIFFSERLGYNEIINNGDFNKFVSDLYIVINGNKYKLDFYEDYRNNEFLFNKDEKVLSDSNYSGDDVIPKYIKDNFQYDNNEMKFVYHEKINNYKLSMTYTLDDNILLVDEIYENQIKKYAYNIRSKNLVFYYNIKNGEFVEKYDNYPNIDSSNSLQNEYAYFINKYIKIIEG